MVWLALLYTDAIAVTTGAANRQGQVVSSMNVIKQSSLRVSGKQDESDEKSKPKHPLYIVVALIIIVLFSNSDFVFCCLPLEV